ncbi:ankyrin, partial [Fragilariopsis cylindrus CCMP1102]
GDVDEVRAILEYGNIDLNLSDYDQRTPLHLAASEGQAEIIQLLCEKGADANRKDRWGNRALDDAIAANNTACIKILKK